MTLIAKRQLGRTGLNVTELGLGGFQFTNEFNVPRAEADAMLDFAFASGVNFVDTAPMYGFGESEELVGRALDRTDAPVIVSTKIGWLDRTIVRKHGDAAYQDESALLRVFEHSLRLLGRQRVEIAMVHEPDWPQWGIDPATGDGPIIRVLERLKDEGRAGAIGAGTRNNQMLVALVETGRVDLVLSFMHYDLAVQDIREQLLPAIQRRGAGLILGGPFRQGALAVKQRDRLAAMKSSGDYPWGFDADVVRRCEKIYHLSDETGIDLPELGIRYLLADPLVSSVIPGPRRIEELRSNLDAAARGPLPDELVRRIDAIGSD